MSQELEVAVKTCGQRAARCECAKPEGHVTAGDAVHACGDTQKCGGQWTGVYGDESFGVTSFPMLGTLL